jgi:hypothetical protein
MIANRKPPRRRLAGCFRPGRRAWQIMAAVSLLASPAYAPRAFAQEEKPEAPSLPEASDDTGPTLTDQFQTMQQELAELKQRMAESEEQRLKSVPALSFNGYVDFGYFAPIGNDGVGWIRDSANVHFPQYANYAWTFLGDILATAVNTRGEVASLGNAPGINRFDSVASAGAGGFIVNEVNLRPRYQLADNAIMRASIDFVPRTGSDFALGDFIDVDQAELEYLPTKDGKTSIFIGKMMPIFGIEYKERKSDQRFGITPSLVDRYTTGSQLGVKVRSKLLNDWLILAGAVTNGSTRTGARRSTAAPRSASRSASSFIMTTSWRLACPANGGPRIGPPTTTERSGSRGSISSTSMRTSPSRPS